MRLSERWAAILCIPFLLSMSVVAADAPSGASSVVQPEGASPVLGPDTPAATLDGKTITLGELENRPNVKQQLFELRKNALNDIINERIFTEEAASRKMTVDQLLQDDVLGKVPEATDEEVHAFYETYKTQIEIADEAQAAPQIRGYLKRQKSEAAVAEFFKALREKRGVKILLNPPRTAVSMDDDPTKGPTDAPITIVEFSDYQCPFCQKAETVVAEVMKKYPGKIRLTFRDYPLSSHEHAGRAAEAAQCAKAQGKFWEMHAAIFADQSKLAADDLIATASKLGIGQKKFKKCLEDGTFKEEVKKDMADGTAYGVASTPTFFINGILLSGGQDLDGFSAIIDEELSRGR